LLHGRVMHVLQQNPTESETAAFAVQLKQPELQQESLSAERTPLAQVGSGVVLTS